MAESGLAVGFWTFECPSSKYSQTLHVWNIYLRSPLKPPQWPNGRYYMNGQSGIGVLVVVH